MTAPLPSQTVDGVASATVHQLAVRQRAVVNTDTVLSSWADPRGEITLLLTQGLGLGINLGGRVIVMPPRDWVQLYDLASQGSSGAPQAERLESKGAK